MPNPGDISSYFSSLFNTGLMGKLMTYLGYFMLVVVILAVLVFIYYWTQFKYKVTYPILHYDTDGKRLQIIGYKKDYARIIKKRDGSRKTQFLFKRVYTEPLTDEVIKPRNKVQLLRINNDGTYTPMPNVESKDGSFQFELIDQQVKTWAILELKETAAANQTDDVVKTILRYTLVAIIISVVVVLLSIWLTLKYTGNVTDALKAATPALERIAGGLGGVVPN